MGPVSHILTRISALLIALISTLAAPALPIPAFPGEVRGDNTAFERDAAGVKVINEGVDRATAGPAATAQTTALQKQKVLAGWEHPAGYTKYDDGTVVAQDGQIYTPSRRSDGTIRTNTLGHPIFNTQSGGTRAQTTLTKPSTSGSTIVVAPNRTFDFTTSGTGNDLRRFTTLDGSDVRINSGHAYNRTHAGGDVSQIGTMDEIENAILRDISANSRLGSLQPRTTQTHTIQVNGQTVGYSLADTPVGANINYYPAIE